jgi:DNA-binding beta-propeller fold protein YncE
LVVYDDAARGSTVQVIGRDAKSHQDRGSGLLRRPTDFAVDESSARAFVVNAGLDRVEVFRDGHYLTRWGEEGDAEGQFRFAGSVEVVVNMASGEKAERRVVAGGITRDLEGFVYIADTFNHRIQKFQP